MHEDDNAQKRRRVANPRTQQYTLTSDAILIFFLIIIFLYCIRDYTKLTENTHTLTKFFPSMCIWKKKSISNVLSHRFRNRRPKKKNHLKCIRIHFCNAHMTLFPIANERCSEKKRKENSPSGSHIETTHQYYRHVIHRLFLRCRHQRRPLILWLQLRDVHDEVLAVDQSDWALFSIWVQSLPLQHITQWTQLFSFFLFLTRAIK